MHKNFKDYLLNFKNVNIEYIANPGNAGDSLIAAGAYQLFDIMGIAYNIPSRDKKEYKNKVVFYGGGGNLGLMKNFSARFLSRIYSSVDKLVILPHTIKDIDPLLRLFKSNVDIFCREQVSFNYVKSSGTRANVYISDDLAIGLNTEMLLNYNPKFSKKIGIVSDYLFAKIKLSGKQPPSFSALKNIFKCDRTLKLMNEVAGHDNKTLQAFRTDSEKTEILIPVNNLDVSHLLEMGVETKELAYMNSHYFLTFLNKFEKVRTNRLHVAIGATLLNKNVEFYDNAYYKCKAVYDYSLKEFSNIKYMGRT